MFEVHNEYASAVFENERDAVNALYLLGRYYGIETDAEEVKKGLEENGCFEWFPLSVVKSGGGKRAERYAKETARELGVQAYVIDSRKIAGLECGLSGLGAVQEKLEMLLTGDMDDYFGSTEDAERLRGFNRARVCLGIIMDYVERAGEELEAAKKLLQECRESERVPLAEEGTEKAVSGNTGKGEAI